MTSDAPRYLHAGQFGVFHDHEGSPFYKAEGRSPEETWHETIARMDATLAELVSARGEGRFRIAPELLIYWHKAIFSTTFPADAGRFRWKTAEERWEDVYFGIDIGTRSSRRKASRKGAAPRTIPGRVEKACQEFNRAVDAILAQRQPAPSLEAASDVVARLYAKLLSIHPWGDGNLRVAYVALQAALLTLDLPLVEFKDLAEHDEKLGTALRSDGKQSYGPLSSLLARTIREAEPPEDAR